VAGSTYYFEVQGARSDVFGIGGYRLQVNYSLISPLVIADFNIAYNNTSATTTSTSPTNISISTAMNLDQSAYIGNQGYDRAIISSLSSSNTVAYFQVVAKSTAAGTASTLIATVSAVNGSSLISQITVLDQTGNALNAQILVNESGTYLVQLANATPNATYYVEVSPGLNAGTHTTGSYLLGVDYINAPIVLTKFGTDTLSGTNNQDFYSMSVPVTQITHFVLSASDPTATVATAVRMCIYDSHNNIIFAMDAIAGQTVSADVSLAKGTYTIRFVAATIDGSALSPLTFNLLGETLTDPINALPVDPTQPPPPPPPDPTPVVVAANPTNPPSVDLVASPWTPLPPPPPPPS
jgi:hypothetical protein